jgi:Spy/CpxP family protein refolding chaperone
VNKEGGHKLKKVILIAIAVAAMLAATLAFAQPGSPGRMADKLKLTDQQQEQLDNLRLQLQKDLVQKQADLKLARLDLKEIMMKTPIDEKAALKKQDQISSIRADIAKAKLQHIIAASKVLTADQLAQWKKMRRGMGERRGHGRRGGTGRGMMGPGMGPMNGGMMWHEGMPGPHKMGQGWMNNDQAPKTEEKEPGK